MRTTPLLSCLGLMSCAAQHQVAPPASEVPRRNALGVEAPFRMVTVGDGVELAVHDSAPGSNRPVLVCLHAIGHGGGDFASVEEALGDRWRVIALDWPGQGRSGPDPSPASAIRYSILLGELVDQLELGSFTILGNSIGGAAAIRYAAAHPDRIDALILANPGGLDPGGGSFLGRLIIGNYVRHFEAGARGEVDYQPWFRDYYDGILITPEARTRKNAIIAAAYETAPVLVQAWDSFRQPEADLSGLLPSLRMPVLVTWAARDEIVSWSRNRASVDRIPHAKVVFFEAGHAAFLEQPLAFNAELETFLGGVPQAWGAR